MRLFFSVDIPPHPAFEKLYEGLKGVSRELKPVHPSRHHITLKFLGDPGTTIDNVIDAASPVGPRHSRFDMNISSSGAFSNWRKPSVLWLGLTPAEELTLIATDIDRMLHEGIGSDLEKRDFRAHMTVARCRSRRPFDTEAAKQLMEDALEELLETGYTVPVKEFCLISSTLTPKGPIYTKRSSFLLSGDRS